MNIYRKNLALCIMTTFIGCSNNTSEEQTKTSNLIFDNRKTHQSRVLLDKAVQTSDPVTQRRYAQSAFLSTGNASLRIERYYDVKNNCDPNDKFERYGSAQLTSPNRLVTAHHVVSNLADDYVHVVFDGDYKSQPSRGWWADDADYQATVTDCTTMDRCEENPLLANRLFQLGLDYWAVNGYPLNGSIVASEHAQQTRPALRQWLALLDKEGLASGDDQPFVTQDPQLDIYFLKVVRLKEAMPMENFGDLSRPKKLIQKTV